jgi:hypothetical protein
MRTFLDRLSSVIVGVSEFVNFFPPVELETAH